MTRTGFCASLRRAAACFACTSPAEIGDECADSADCTMGLSCFEHEGVEPSPVCMEDCDLSTQRLCSTGAVCTPASGPDRPADLGVCYLGGTAAVGDECNNNLQCALGTICVLSGGSQRCFRACSTDDGSACEAAETCEGLVDMGTRGYCNPTP